MTTPESYLATQPEAYIAYAPRGPGLECAVTYFVHGDDVYGWWIGFKDYNYPSAFFKLENFFADADTDLLRHRGFRRLRRLALPVLQKPAGAGQADSRRR